MKVAVVGAGVFGATAAVELARAGATVDLYDGHDDILQGASRANQGRLHMGYHYPRSPETIAAVQTSAPQFAKRFPDAIRRFRHHYCIARDSALDAATYLTILDRAGLPYVECEPPLVHGGVAASITVPEALIDIRALRQTLRRELAAAGVTVHLRQRVHPARLDADQVVMATYGQPWPQPLRHEICEIPLVKLGPQFEGQSFVILDGPFISLDPVPGRPGVHMLYDVNASVHHASEGLTPEIPDGYRRLLDAGPVIGITNVDAMLSNARRFLRGVGLPSYIGSLYTIRTVLPGVDDTDERPTCIYSTGRTVHILSGKIDTAVWAAQQITELVSENYESEPRSSLGIDSTFPNLAVA